MQGKPSRPVPNPLADFCIDVIYSAVILRFNRAEYVVSIPGNRIETFQYRQFYTYLMMLQAKKIDPDAFRYYSESELLENIAQEIYRINECLEPQSYNEAAYTAEKMAFVEGMRDRMEIMAESYIGLSREEALSTRDMTVARINVLLEDHYGED